MGVDQIGDGVVGMAGVAGLAFAGGVEGIAVGFEAGPLDDAAGGVGFGDRAAEGIGVQVADGGR